MPGPKSQIISAYVWTEWKFFRPWNLTQYRKLVTQAYLTFCAGTFCPLSGWVVEVCKLMVDLLVKLNSGFVKVDEHCHHFAINAVFFSRRTARRIFVKLLWSLVSWASCCGESIAIHCDPDSAILFCWTDETSRMQWHEIYIFVTTILSTKETGFC